MALTNTSQLSDFTLIQNALLANEFISKNFKSSQFYEFEPYLKNTNTKLPLFVVQIPSTDPNTSTFSNPQAIKDLTTMIIMKHDFSSKDKARDYVNAVIDAIESYRITFEANGINHPKISHAMSQREEEDEKTIVVSEFEFKYQGVVNR